ERGRGGTREARASVVRREALRECLIVFSKSVGRHARSRRLESGAPWDALVLSALIRAVWRLRVGGYAFARTPCPHRRRQTCRVRPGGRAHRRIWPGGEQLEGRRLAGDSGGHRDLGGDPGGHRG